MKTSSLSSQFYCSIVSAILFTVLLPNRAFAQSPIEDLNNHYRFPVSLGFQYQAVKPMSQSGAGYDAYDISANLRFPLPSKPTLQPGIQGGIVQVASSSADDQWNHQSLYGLMGIGYVNRISKDFELGGDLQFGASLSMFSRLVPDEGSLASPNLLGQITGKIGITPSYGFCIELNPVLRYSRSLSPLKEFGGLSIGFGAGVNIRFGDDPDSAKAQLRSLRFEQGPRAMVFPAMQSWYVSNPFSSIKISNTESFPVQEVVVQFFQKGFMDSPSVCVQIPVLGPGESMDIPVTASFNQEVFRNEGAVPLSGEISVSYRGRGRDGEQKFSLSYDLQDKSAIVWDDDRKAAAFITASDSALRNYASTIRQAFRNDLSPETSPELQYARQLYYALAEIGILYQLDPLQPFAQVAENAVSVDSVSLPRDTLKRATGDCDDLSVLFTAMLETAGMESALVTVPGHILVALNTKIPSRLYANLHPDRNMTIAIGDELWIPIETTLIGVAGFMEAWQNAALQWKATEQSPGARGFYPVRAAQELYRPVGLRETDLGLQYGNMDTVRENVHKDLAGQIDAVLAPLVDTARKTGTKEAWNRLGVRQARLGQTNQAAESFKQAMALDKTYPSPVLNLANVYFMAKDYARALTEYKKAEKLLGNTTSERTVLNLQLNLASCYGAMNDVAQANIYIEKAVKIDPTAAASLAALVQPASASQNDGGARAGQTVQAGFTILFDE